MRDRPYNRIYKEDDSRASELQVFHHMGVCQQWGMCRLVFFIDSSFHEHEKCELFHFSVFFTTVNQYPIY